MHSMEASIIFDASLMYMTLMSLYITHVMQVKVCVMNTIVIIIILSSSLRLGLL